MLLFLSGCADIDVRLLAADTAEIGVDSEVVVETADTAPALDSADTAGDTRGVDAVGWAPSSPAELLPASGEGYRSVWLVDLNADGHLDLVSLGLVLSGSDYDIHVHVLEGTGSGFGASSDTVIGSGYGSWWTLADVTGDGSFDVAYLGADGVHVVPGAASGFGETIPGEAFDGTPNGLLPIDMNGDGGLELTSLGTLRSGAETRATVFEVADGALAASANSALGLALSPTSLIPLQLEVGALPVVVVAAGGTGYGSEVALQLFDPSGDALIATLLTHDRYSDDGALFGFGRDVDGDGRDELFTSGVDGLQMWNPATQSPSFIRFNDFLTSPLGLLDVDLDGNGEHDALEYLAYSVTTDHSWSYTARLSWNLGVEGVLSAAEQADFDIGPTGAYPGAVPLAAGDVDEDGCADVAFLDGSANVWFAAGVCGG